MRIIEIILWIAIIVTAYNTIKGSYRDGFRDGVAQTEDCVKQGSFMKEDDESFFYCMPN